MEHRTIWIEPVCGQGMAVVEHEGHHGDVIQVCCTATQCLSDSLEQVARVYAVTFGDMFMGVYDLDSPNR
jgi:hypothetical protein